MTWQDFIHDMQRCTRCSYCKYIPWRLIRNFRFSEGCPSAARYHWHAYAAGGKFNLAYSLLQGAIDINDSLLEVVYKCLMDGSCDIACKVQQDLEPLQHMQEFRVECVARGYLLPQHQPYLRSLRAEDNMLLRRREERGYWAEGLEVKRVTSDKAEVVFFAGCRYSYDQDLWPVARAAVHLLQRAGVDVGILGADEACCAGRAYELGYEGELMKFAEHQRDTLATVARTAGVHTLVTACSDCYSTFKVLYDKIGKKSDVEVCHITQYLERLIQEGRLRPRKSLDLNITYHDPCHLGRLGEPWIHWQGREYKPVGTQIWLHDPPKRFRRGTHGVYEPPRNVLKSIPGLELVEMYRTREYAWCCGAGGGVIDAYPDFAQWTAAERLEEAHEVGAEAIVSACPWCKRNFLDTAAITKDRIGIFDLVELVERAVGGSE